MANFLEQAMRRDMHELLVERPRLYRGYRARAGCTYPRTALSRARSEDDLPARESYGSSRYREKSLNENLQPLVRFLRTRVGMPWTRVYAEIRSQVNGRSAVQKHILEHLFDYVKIHVWEHRGALFVHDRGGPTPLLAARRRDTFYVCPSSGILKAAKVRAIRGKKGACSPNYRKRSETHYWMKRPGGWFEVWLAPRPLWSDKGPRPVDVLSRARIDTSAHRHFCAATNAPWAWSHFAIATRQLGKVEIRAYFERHT